MSDEYSRTWETLANLNRKQEKMLCPVCGRYYTKWYWRTPCCGAELVWVEPRESEDILDKIRDEIFKNRNWHMSHGQEDAAMIIDLEALAVIDKYKAESEDKK